MVDEPKSQTTDERISIVINFADGGKMTTFTNAREGAFCFRVVPECPAITSIEIKAPSSKVQFLS